MPLSILSLFSGIGAFERALKNLGITYDLAGYCENDKYASKAYSLLHSVPESMNLGDITSVDETSLPLNLDLVTYGFPCQDISIAGRKRGFTDSSGRKTRSGLFFDALRIIKATRPKIAVAENVKHLTSKNMRPIFELVLKSLEEAGYNNYWQVMNCADFGLPQNRERVLIVSIRKDIDDKGFVFPEAVPLTTCMGDYLDDDVPEPFYLSEEKTKSVINHNASHPGHIGERNGVCPSLLARDCRDPKVVNCSKSVKQIADLHYYGNDQMNRIYSPQGLRPTLKTVSGGGREIKISNGDRYRKLTPVEYFRLMGFTDDDVRLLSSNKISKTQLYKLAGNSIPVKMLEHLFKKLYSDTLPQRKEAP